MAITLNLDSDILNKHVYGVEEWDGGPLYFGVSLEPFNVGIASCVIREPLTAQGYERQELRPQDWTLIQHPLYPHITWSGFTIAEIPRPTDVMASWDVKAVHVFDTPGRDTGNRILSLAYTETVTSASPRHCVRITFEPWELLPDPNLGPWNPNLNRRIIRHAIGAERWTPAPQYRYFTAIDWTVPLYQLNAQLHPRNAEMTWAYKPAEPPSNRVPEFGRWAFNDKTVLFETGIDETPRPPYTFLTGTLALSVIEGGVPTPMIWPLGGIAMRRCDSYFLWLYRHSYYGRVFGGRTLNNNCGT